MKKLKHIVSFVMVFALIFTSIPLTTFKAEAVDSAPSTDIVYGSNGNITRAEWLHDLAVVFDMSVESDAVPDNYFSDLESSHPYYNDIMLTVEFGVVDVEAGGNIFVDDLVSRDFAVTTLNFCLGYQASDEDTYTFSDSSECSSPTDALIAVEHGWVELIDNKFMPELPITSDEAKKMLDNAASVLDVSDIDANYDSKYVFQDDVIVVPEWVNTVEENMTFTIENSPVTISQGNLFAIYENGIPAVYVAENVTNDGNLTIITAKKNEGNDAFKEIDAQGQISSNDMEFYACEDVELTLSESESAPAMRKAPGLKAVKSQVKLKKDINLKTKVPLGKGLEANLTVNIYNPVVNYQLSRSYSYATLEGDTEISYSIKGDLTDALGTKSKKLFTCSVAGIGSFDVTVEMRFSGEIKGKVRGNLTAGLECVRGDRIRAIHVFQQKTCYFAAGAEASIGLKASLGITKLPGLQAYVFAEVGAKASLWSTSYDTAPYRCTHFSAYMYMRFSAYASVNLFGWKKSADYTINVFDEKNSPIKVVHHYEDGVEVPACTRGTSHTRYFTKYDSHYGGSGWTGANGSYGLDGGGNSISLYQYSVNDDNEATITKYNGNSYSVYIPETIDGYTVVKIGNSAFANKSIHDVSIPDSVTEIDSYAFNNCKYLKEVKLSEYLTYLGKRAFGSTAIESIEIPKTLDSCGWTGGFDYDFDGTSVWIYGGPFYHCENLKTITFEKGTTQIAENLFRGCTGLETITVPDTIAEIEKYAFEGCVRLTEVSIPDSVTEIGEHAFKSCVSLPEIIIPNTITKINTCTFENCSSLASVSIPDSVMTIDRYAFSQCVSLPNISIPDSVTNIYECAFNECSSLESVKLPGYIQNIAYNMFQNCTSLKTVEFPSTVTTIQNAAFAGCTSLESFSFQNGKSNLQTIKYNAFQDCASLKEAVLPETINTVENNAFRNCVSLEKVYIPESTRTLGGYVFQGDELLKDVTISDYSITKINECTFKDCPALASIVLPKGLTEIGNQAFMNDTALFDVTIPESVTSITNSAFSYPAKTIIHGKAGSYAETFANDGGFKFNDIGIAAEGISLIDGIENITLDVGETYRAKFEFYPEDANDVVTMTSDNRNVSINGHDIKANYSGNSVITATSSSGIPYEFNIHTRSPRKITIKTPANKLSYLIGEEFERTGLVAEVTYDDNSTKDVTDFTISGFDSYAEGSCTVTLSWLSANGYTYKTTFSVEIVDPTPKLTGITIKSVPNKLMYERKESLNLTGLSVIGTYSDDSNREITDYTISGYNALKYGKQTITVSYNEKTATFTVAVKCATHTFNEWTTEKEPICTESGKKVHICSVCGLVEEEVIPATGHDYKTVVIEPTYTEQGYTLHTCSHCGDSYKDNYTEKLIEQLANDSVLSAETIKLGETITATGKATGGTAPYQYQVVYKKSADSKWTTAQSYKANTTVTFKPASATTYDVCIKVKDSTGTEVKKFFNINVSSILTNNSTISATSIGLGSTLTATGKANGGTAPYQYQVVYKKSTDSKWTTAQSYKANTTVTFKPASATTYDVCIKVKDSTGTEVKKFFTVKVTDALKNNSVISKTEISLGDTITVSGKATGGTSPYQYNILYKQTAQSKWTTVQSYKTNSTVTIKPAKATTYDVCVKIKDSNGTIVKKFFTVQVNAKLANTSTISATEIKKGNTVTVNGSATGGAGNYTYAVFYKQKAQTQWTTKQDFNENTNVSIKPMLATDYDICVKVKDKNGTIAKQYFTVTVTK